MQLLSQKFLESKEKDHSALFVLYCLLKQLLTATLRTRLSLEIFRLSTSADRTTSLICGKHPNFSPLPRSRLRVPNMSQHLKWLSRKNPSLHAVPKPYVVQNISSHPTHDGAHPSQTFPYNPELFPCSCLASLNPENPSWLFQLLLLCLPRLQIVHGHSPLLATLWCRVLLQVSLPLEK